MKADVTRALTGTHRNLSTRTGAPLGSSEGAAFSFLVKRQPPHRALAVSSCSLFYFTFFFFKSKT